MKFFAFVFLLPLIFCSPAHASSKIDIQNPFIKAPPSGAKTAAAFMTIENKGSDDDRLISATSLAADKTQLHTMTMNEGVMQMRELKDGVEIKAGQSILLESGGNHIMLIGLRQILKAGGAVTLVLQFEKAGEVPVTVQILPLGAASKH